MLHRNPPNCEPDKKCLRVDRFGMSARVHNTALCTVGVTTYLGMYIYDFVFVLCSCRKVDSGIPGGGKEKEKKVGIVGEV